MIGGIDLGGTKIEARLFDLQMREVARRRRPTPSEDYAALLGALQDQIAWLKSFGDISCVGVGSPGLIDPRTGTMLTANLPASGRSLERDLSATTGLPITLINDSSAAALAEATDGAGANHHLVVGLVIGTGVAGGVVVGGRLLPDLNGQHAEFGHLPMPAEIVQRHALPLQACGCGLSGCFETYISGPGLTRLAELKLGHSLPPEEVLERAEHSAIRGIWADLCGSLIATIIRTIDPSILVLSGGIGTAQNVLEPLRAALSGKILHGTKLPILAQAAHGDASGARGAAFFARQRMLDAT